MSLNPNPTISEQAENIKTWLEAWANPRGGTVAVLQIQHLWQKVYEVTDEKPMILVSCNGENARGGFNQANTLHRVDRQWIVVVMKGHGFKSDVSQPGPTVGALPLWDYLELIREQLRLLENVSEEFPIDYKGWKPVPNPSRTGQANIFMDAEWIDFSTANDLPYVQKQ